MMPSEAWMETLNISASAFAHASPKTSMDSDGLRRSFSTSDESPPKSPDESKRFGEVHEIPIEEEVDSIMKTAQGRSKMEVSRRNRVIFLLLLLCLTCVMVASLVLMGQKTKNDNDGQNELSAVILERVKEANAEKVDEFLITHDISALVDLANPGTPQHRAKEWLASSLNLEFPEDDNPASEYRFAARYIMAVNFFALGGENWKWQTPFLKLSSVCSWQHASYDGIVYGVTCDDNGFPTELNLASHGLKGTLPTENARLVSLQSINLAHNDIQGSIPEDICWINNLKNINMAFNAFTGSLPPCMGKMENLEHLDLAQNQLGGSLPHGEFESIVTLNLNFNDFSDSLPKIIASMKDLRHLHVSHNRFYGQITSAFDNLVDSLTHVDVSFNKLSASFPKKLLQVAPHLKFLDLGGNAIEGNFPWWIPTNTELTFLSVQSNRITGPLTPALGNLTALTHLVVSHNQLQGQLPSTLSQASGLTSLFLDNNPSLSEGPIPQAWSSLTSLRAFDARNTSRAGPLPHWIGQSWTELEVLDLSHNRFNGDIPTVWNDLGSLEYLVLNNNPGLTGGLPQSFDSLRNLEKIFLHQTSVSAIWTCPAFLDGTDAIIGPCSYQCSCCSCCDSWDCAQSDLHNLQAMLWMHYRTLDSHY